MPGLETNKLGAEAEAGTLVGRDGHGGGERIKDGEHGGGADRDGEDLVHGEGLAGDEDHAQGNRNALD